MVMVAIACVILDIIKKIVFYLIKVQLDRGLFQAVIYHTEKDEDKKINGDQEIRCKSRS